MKLLKLFLSLIIIASVVLCQQIISNSISSQKNKNDYAELNHVKYGLFSVEEWKRQITVILAEEINNLDLSTTNVRELRKHIEVLLNTLIDPVFACGKSIFFVDGPDYWKKDNSSQGQAHRDTGRHSRSAADLGGCVQTHRPG